MMPDPNTVAICNLVPSASAVRVENLIAPQFRSRMQMQPRNVSKYL